MLKLASRIAARLGLDRGRPRFAGSDVVVGRRVRFGRNVVFNCRRVRIGDGVWIQDDVTIDAEVFEIGDYGTIYRSCFFPGPGTLRIGHNFWLGPSSIVDAMAGTIIGDNVGVGAHSQLWTHMVFGDVMAGCRFDGAKPLTIEHDAWLVGHCLVSPVRIGTRSIALLGSLVTSDLEPDRIYAGVPARDVTERFGPPYAATTPEQRSSYLRQRLEVFAASRGLGDVSSFARIVTGLEEAAGAGESVTVFDVASRRYVKRGTPLEHDLMRFLLPRAKFTPLADVGEPGGAD